MRFSLFALVTSQSVAMRPMVGRAAVSRSHSQKDSSGDDAELFISVSTLVERTTYTSIDDARACAFTAHNDGFADGVVVTGAGTARWNGCYDRAEASEEVPIADAVTYRHQEHNGAIYSLKGTWRIADFEANYTAYQVPDVLSHNVPSQGWVAGRDARTPAGEGSEPAPSAHEAFVCSFTAQNDGLADGVIVTGAGSARWNGCYDRAEASEEVSAADDVTYRHQQHNGAIYSLKGTWRIADFEANYTAYQVPGVTSQNVPSLGWAAGLDDRTPAGEGDEPAPRTREAIKCAITAHNDGLADGVLVTGAGSRRWNGCYYRAEPSEDVSAADDVTYRHQDHNGAIYSLKGTWRIADFEANYTAYQVPGVTSQNVPSQGWAAGLDDRTPPGEGDGPAPSTRELTASGENADVLTPVVTLAKKPIYSIYNSVDDATACGFTAHSDGFADGVVVTGAGTARWNGCYDRAEASEEVPIADALTYRHQEHNGAIYSLKGTWRIADFEANYTAYQVPGVLSDNVPSLGWAAGRDSRTPAGQGEVPAPTTREVFQCVFTTAHNDGLADGIVVTGAGSARWNGCYDRAEASEEVSAADDITYRHQGHNGAIYSLKGTWRIADFEANYTAYQVPGVTSQNVPSQGWAAGLDDRTPAGEGDEPAPSTREVIKCAFTAHSDGLADGIVVTGAGTARWNGCYDRAEESEEVPIADTITYRHQDHNGAIYSLKGTWRIADFEANYTAYRVPGVRSQNVPCTGWVAGLDKRTPAGEGNEPAPSIREVKKCVFTAHNDGLADGVIVTGAGTARWNGCYSRAEASEEVSVADDVTYRHQEHNGAIYSLHGVWRIADFEAQYTAYQAPGVMSLNVPSQGWVAGRDDRTPAGEGNEPAPSIREVIA